MKYQVQILDQPFRNEFVTSSQTARVTFYHDNQILARIMEYGVISQEEVETQLEATHSLHMDCCYIARLNLDKKMLQSCSASGAFIESGSFEGTVFADKALFLSCCFGKNSSFSQAIFDQEIYFENAMFFDRTSFVETTFGGEVNFVRTRFFGTVDFQKAVFESKVEWAAAIFQEEVSFEQAFFSDNAYYESAIFQKNSRFAGAVFQAEVNFTYARFGGDVTFEGATFSGKAYWTTVTFRGEVLFSHTNFLQEASFESDTFFGKAKWVAVNFAAEANFIYSRFMDEAGFSLSGFGGEAVFRAAEFSGPADFVAVTFQRAASFSGAKFLADVSFGTAAFSQSANFESVYFKKVLNFSYGAVEEGITFDSATFNFHVDFSHTKAQNFNLNNCTIEKTVDLRHSEIENLSVLDVKNMGLIYIEWEREKVRQALCQNRLGCCERSWREKTEIMSDGIEHLAQSLSKNFEDRETPHFNLARQFRMFKENFHDLGQYDDEDAAYVQFKKQEALAQLFGEGERVWIKRCLQALQFPFKWFIGDLIGLYGTSPKRILFSLIANIFLFSFIYYLCGFGLADSLQDGTLLQGVFGWGEVARFKASLYFSAITSFTVGYGDLSPKTELIAFWACVESFFGVFLMSYFTVAFSRKILR